MLWCCCYSIEIWQSNPLYLKKGKVITAHAPNKQGRPDLKVGALVQVKYVK